MQFSSPRFLRAAAVAGLALTVGVAQAHTGHGTSGISEGLAHPLGADHLLAMVAVGIWSVSALPAGKAWWGPATFLLSLVISATLGAAGLHLPFLEQMIALSVVVFGAMLVLIRVHMSVAGGLGLVALAAALHGLAHGAEAPEAGFATYALGFVATTAALHFGGVVAGLGIRQYMARKATWAMAGLGTLCSGGGLYLFGQL
jgi:urease accessory protein